MPVFKHILVPVDLTDTHQPALEIAARLAQANDGEVTLLHVVEAISEVWATEDREFYTRLEQTARDHLARLGHYVEARGVPRREEVVFGHRAPEIVRYAPGQMRPARHGRHERVSRRRAVAHRLR